MSELVSKRLDFKQNLFITFLVTLFGLISYSFANYKTMLDYEIVLVIIAGIINSAILLYLLKGIRKLDRELENELKKGGAK